MYQYVNRMKDLMDLLKKDLSHVSKLDNNRKFLLLVLFVMVFGASVFVGNMIFNKGALPAVPGTGGEEVAEVVPTAKPTSTLMFSPAAGEWQVGEATKVSVMLEGVPVTASDVVVTFDPTLVSVSEPVNGTVFAQVIRNTVDEGKILYSASVSPENPESPSVGEVLSFEVTPLEAAAGEEVSLQFDPIETITAIDGESTLGTTVGGVYSVN